MWEVADSLNFSLIYGLLNIPIYSETNLSWETTAMKDHLYWKTKIFRQKYLQFNILLNLAPENLAPVLRGYIFLTEGVFFQGRSTVHAVLLWHFEIATEVIHIYIYIHLYFVLSFLNACGGAASPAAYQHVQWRPCRITPALISGLAEDLDL